jgi:hypothetical protein
MPPRKIPKHLFLELKSEAEDYPAQLKKLREERQKTGKHLRVPSKRLERSGFSQYRGPAYVHLHHGRDVYNVHPLEYLRPLLGGKTLTIPARARPWRLLQDEAGWKNEVRFPEGGAFPGSNHFFNVDRSRPIDIQGQLKGFASFHLPYSWSPHHLVPIEAFSTKTGDLPTFAEEVVQAINDSGYDVNNGHNLMLTPRSTYDIAYHCVIPHQGGHPNFNSYALKDLKKVNRAVEEEIDAVRRDPSRKHEAFFDVAVEKLYETETDYWNKLRDLGRDVVASLLNASHVVQDEDRLLKRVETKRKALWQRVKLG